jgi:hypothetical protein
MMRNWMMAAAMVFSMVGCGAASDLDNEPDTIDDVTKADAVYPAGVYESTTAKLGDFYLLELNADNTYLHKTAGIDCLPSYFGTCGIITGTYKFSHSSTTKYIRFYDENGQFVVRYAYTLTSSGITLREDGQSHTFTMKKSSQNDCVAAGGDCVALAPGSCKGEVQDAREFSCGGGLGVECCFGN